MGFAGTPTLDEVLRASNNKTLEQLKVGSSTYDPIVAVYNHPTTEDAGTLLFDVNRLLGRIQARNLTIGGSAFNSFGTTSILVMDFFANIALQVDAATPLIHTVTLRSTLDGVHDIGSLAKRYRDLHLSGLIVGSSGFSGDLVVDGDIYMDGAVLRTLYGGDDAADVLVLKANSADAYPKITLEGGDLVNIQLGVDKQFDIGEGATCFFGISRKECILESTATTEDAFKIQAGALTSGRGLKISVDSDIVTTGKILELLSGPASDKPVHDVDEDGVVTLGEITGTHSTTLKVSATDDALELGDSVDMPGGAGEWFRPPQMTTAQRNAMVGGFGAADAGKMWYNTDLNQFEGWDGTAGVIL